MCKLVQIHYLFFLGKQLFSTKILQERVPCNLVLSVIAGLPDCGKSYLMHKLMNEVLISPTNVKDTSSPHSPFFCYVPKGLSSYRIVIAGERPFKELMWMEWTPKAMHTFVYSSSISSLQPQQKVELTVDMDLNDGEGFEDKSLNSHLREVYNDVNMFLQRSNLDPKIEKSLPAGMSFVNIVDMVANRGAYDFFIIIARYCSRRFGFLLLSLEKDVPHLSEPPILMNATARSISLIKSRLSFLVRFAAVTYLGTEDYDDSPSTFFIALHKGRLSPDSIKEHVSKLEHELKNEVHRQGLPSEILGEVVAINPDDKNDLNYLKLRMENLVMKRKNANLDLKLSWIFLQSILHSPKTLYIPLDEVKKLAEQLKMEDKEVMEFLHDFTGCCDILYIPDILPNVVILQPFVFINHLFHLFNPTNDLHATYGFISIDEIEKLIGNEATDVVVPAVCNAGLAVEINKSKIIYPESLESEAYLFIPSARSGGLCTLKEQSSLYIVYKSMIMPPDMIGMFVQEFMTSEILTMNVKLYPTTEHNAVTLVLKKGFILTLVFHHDSVEVKLLSSGQAELTTICTEVDRCCRSALSRIQTFFPKLSYRYALLCHGLKHYEYLPKSLEKVCRTCKTFFEYNNLCNAWYHTIQVSLNLTHSVNIYFFQADELFLYNLMDCVKRTPIFNYYANFNTQFIHETIVSLNSNNVLKTVMLTMCLH